ncbi:CBS domain-containing protein [Actinophytocola oryzae]|uniref:BON domain-containing protein n=1 Tax=Actinophytocola oryzae TaxID=502181 RepID=A0A4R7V5T6_9PSEU|nr:CBS domain-containing protein [Actinophytocola oryzae]TDV44112.1 BON domain-containing protein [Actinophytocola oryzae]
MSHQKVRTVMSTDVTTVHEDTPFKDVARALAARDVSAVPVVGRDGRVVGVVSEADLLVKQGTQELDFSRSLLRWWRDRRDIRRASATTAAQLMTAPAITVTGDTTVAGAARVLTEHNVKRLPVVRGDGTLVGIVSRKDLLAVFLRKDEDIRDEVVERVFTRGIGMAVNPATVTVDVHDGEVTLTGQLDLRSQLTLVEDMTRHIDGVVDVTVSMTYQYDDTRGHMPDAMVVDITQPPRVR